MLVEHRCPDPFTSPDRDRDVACHTERIVDARAHVAPTRRPVTAFDVLTELVGWVALRDDAGATLAKTSDAGRTWQRVGPARIASVSSLDELRFIDERNAFAVAFDEEATPRKGIVLATEDGGATWTERLVAGAPSGLPGPNPLRGLVVVDDRHAWVGITTGPAIRKAASPSCARPPMPACHGRPPTDRPVR